MRFSRVLFITIVSLGLLSSCSKVEKQGTAIVEEEEGSSSGTEGSPLYLILKSKYENATSSTNEVTEGACVIGAQDPAGTNLDCSIAIPELRLHYSDLSFTVGVTEGSACEAVVFRPYYFVRSTSATFDSPESTTDVDCSLGDKAECYGGAAKSVIENASLTFPQATGVYFLPINQSTATYTANSSNSYHLEANSDPAYAGNAYIANNISLADRTAGYTGNNVIYLAGTFQDYEVLCQDKYGETQYSIVLTISDKDTVDTDGGITNNYFDWR